MNITSIETATSIKVNVDFSTGSPEKDLPKQCEHKHTCYGSLHLHCAFFAGIYILESTWDTEFPCVLRIFGPPSCLMSHFITNGSIRITIHRLSEPKHIEVGQYHTYYGDHLQTDIEMENPAKLLSLYLAPPFLQPHQIGFSQTMGIFDLPALIIAAEPMNTQIKLVIHEIAMACQPNATRLIFLQSKILELLSIQFETKDIHRVPRSSLLKEIDLQKLHEVKSSVESNLRRPSSLTELSQQSGLNEFKLKKGFKELFGHTVFGYLNELRMEKGKELLKEGYTVGETADAVGYKNAHHFTAAFKKKWGILPSKVKPAAIIMLMTIFDLIVKNL